VWAKSGTNKEKPEISRTFTANRPKKLQPDHHHKD